VYLRDGVSVSWTPSQRYTDTVPKIHRHCPEDTQTPSQRYTDTLPKTDTLLPITLTNAFPYAVPSTKKKRKVSLLSACFFAVYLFTNSYLISPYPSASSHPPNLRRTASTNLQNQVNNEEIQSSSAPSPKDDSLGAEETRRLRLQNDLLEIDVMERKTRLEILRKERDLD
jgi:hypothetical protein